MHRFLGLLGLFKEYLVLTILIVISLVLLSLNDNNQVRAIRSTAVGFVGFMQNALAIIPNVVELKKENEVLRQLNVNLSNEVSLLREARLENLKLRDMAGLKEHSSFKLTAGKVIGGRFLLFRHTNNLGSWEAGRE